MTAFIDDNKGTYGVEPICKVLPIAPSTYYTHVARQADPAKAPPRVQRDAVLSDAVRRVWEENLQATMKVSLPGVRFGGAGSVRPGLWS